MHTAAEIRRAAENRRRVFKEAGAFLLEAPTGAGKTLMLAAVCEAVSADERIVWFWFAPFAGLVEQTSAALVRAAPALRPRDPVRDRAATATRSGDVFVATWAAVAARRAETRRMRQDDDRAESLDTLAARLREGGFLIGAVVDEAHHGFRPGTEAFRFLDEVLRPDLLFLATATPDDTDVELVRRGLDLRRFHHVSVSRARVVAARLNKERVLAVSFVAKGAGRDLLDLNEVALEKAVAHHRALKNELQAAGLPVVPLLLVQARSDEWTPTRVRDVLRGRLGFAEDGVALHTAAEPDPDLLALAADPAVEVLVFKMAVATGFDAPRAATLCALRPVRDAGFGLQVIGRIMRVHPLLQLRHDLPEMLNTGAVFLGDPDGQAGLVEAASRIKAIRDGIRVATDSVRVFQAEVGGGTITLRGEDGQVAFDLTSPEAEPARQPFARGPMDAEQDSGSDEQSAPPAAGERTLFDALMAPQAPPRATPSPSGGVRAPEPPPSAYSYPRRAETPVPIRLRTERMPADVAPLLGALVRHVRFGAEERGIVEQVRAEVERRERDVFDPLAPEARRAEQAAISDLLAREGALRALRVSSYIDPAELARQLLGALRASFDREGVRVPDEKAMRRGLNVILTRNPRLCKDALKRAMAAHVEVVDAADLPSVLSSPVRLPPSPRNLYGVVPTGMNTWERAFADWLDRQSNVLWWVRNAQRDGAANGWGVRIVLAEDGRGYWPDFVVCVEGRKRGDGVALAETKERISTYDSELKSRTEHREYGRALMLTYDPSRDRFERVEYDRALDRNRVVGLLEPSDLL